MSAGAPAVRSSEESHRVPDRERGGLIEVWEDNQGRFHRTDGPAIVRANGDLEYFRHGQRHRSDGPALIQHDGSTLWFLEGLVHREDGPAVEHLGGSEEWYREGKRHRADGPAIVLANGGLEWWIDDERHREDGPAIEWVNGMREWYRHGRLHREDGPALEYPTGETPEDALVYALGGERLTEREWRRRTGRTDASWTRHSTATLPAPGTGISSLLSRR